MQTRPCLPSPGRARQRLAVARIALVLAAVCSLLLAATASAAIVTFKPGFAASSQLGEATTWTSELTFSGSEYHGGVAPLTKLQVHLPAGVGGSSAGFPVCEEATLATLGPSGCPAGSMAGPVGSIGFEGKIGPELIQETGTIQAVFAPAEDLLFYIQATAPLNIEVVAAGTYVADTPPYGKVLKLELPLIESVPGAPYVGTTALTLNLGATREAGGMVFPSVTVPSECPPAGAFPWQADAMFNEEPTPVDVTFTGPCPGSESRSSTTTTIQISNPAPLIGEAVTYTATVTPAEPGSALPSGMVAFLDEGVSIAGCTTQPLTAGVASSTATCQVSYAAPGSHSITATYAGDTNFLGSSAAVLPVIVQPSSTTGGGSPLSSGSGPTGGSTSGGTSGASSAAIGTAQIAASLGQQLIPSGKAAKIAALLKSGGLIASFKALEAGTLSVQWYVAPSGAKLAKHGKAKPMLVASGKLTFAAAGTGRLKVALTAAGKHLLKHAKRLKLMAKGAFTPTGEAPVSATVGLVVRR